MAGIDTCPFAEPGVPNTMTGERLEDEVVCRKMIDGQVLPSGRIVRGGCVGEDNCPDMQTHLAVMKLLAAFEAVNKVL